jgi:hypothetical protein
MKRIAAIAALTGALSFSSFAAEKRASGEVQPRRESAHGLKEARTLETQSLSEAIRYEKWKERAGRQEAQRSRRLRAGTQETQPDDANIRGSASRGEPESTVQDPGARDHRNSADREDTRER